MMGCQFKEGDPIQLLDNHIYHSLFTSSFISTDFLINILFCLLSYWITAMDYFKRISQIILWSVGSKNSLTTLYHQNHDRWNAFCLIPAHAASMLNSKDHQYRLALRWGWRLSRKTHSNPSLLIQCGDLGMVPEWKSNAAPTPHIQGAWTLCRWLAIHISCFGKPSPTQTISGRASLIMLTTASSSSGVNSRNGGQ